MALAYSYIRWSSDKQTDGDSLERQNDAASKYAKAHGLTLSDTSYLDPGVSAFTGKNLETGALGAFLKAVDSGKIPSDATLLVEDFDRLSRLPPLKALRILEDIVDRGLTLITLTDNKVYNTKTIDTDWSNLVVALLKMSRAHEEIKRKTGMIKEAWDRKKSDPSIAFTARGPSWLKLDKAKNKWVPIKSQIVKVKKVFELALEGHGATTIARLMNNKFKMETLLGPTTIKAGTAKERVVGERWSSGTVLKLLNNVAVIGVFEEVQTPAHIKENKVQLRIDDYYGEPVIPKDVFQTIQRQISSRHHEGGKRSNNVANLFSGHLKCSCGSNMRFVNGNKKYFYVRCLTAYSSDACKAGSFPYLELEDSVLSQVLFTAEHLDHTSADDNIIDTSLIIRTELIEKRAAEARLLAVVIAGKEMAGGSTAAAKILDKLALEIQELENTLKNHVQPPSQRDMFTKAITLLTEHEEHKEFKETSKLIELRLRLAALMREMITTIVIPIEDVMEFENRVSFGGDGDEVDVEYGEVKTKAGAKVKGDVAVNANATVYGGRDHSHLELPPLQYRRVAVYGPAAKSLIADNARIRAEMSVHFDDMSMLKPEHQIQGPTGDGGAWVAVRLKEISKTHVRRKRFAPKKKAPKGASKPA